MKPIDVAVTRLAARQYSLAHRHQLLDLGMTARQIHSRMSAGWLMPVHQSVYLVGSGASSPEQALMAAHLAAGSEALASHRSAAALWRMRGVETPAMPEITLWADRHRPLHGVTVHRTQSLDSIDVSRARRIPVTTPARTLLDLGAVAPAHVVEPYIRLGLEADSRVWHGGRLDVQRNSDKANVLVAHGWRVLHFTFFDLTRRSRYVVGAVAQELAWAA